MKDIWLLKILVYSLGVILGGGMLVIIYLMVSLYLNFNRQTITISEQGNQLRIKIQDQLFEFSNKSQIVIQQEKGVTCLRIVELDTKQELLKACPINGEYERVSKNTEQLQN